MAARKVVALPAPMRKRWWAPGERQCIIDSTIHKSDDIASHHRRFPPAVKAA